MRPYVPARCLSHSSHYPITKDEATTTFNWSSCKISQDGQIAWVVKGCTLEVFSTSKMERLSFWRFKTDNPDSSINIKCVTQFNSTQLLFVIDEVNLLCLFDINTSKVFRAVRLPGKIDTLEPVLNDGGTCPQNRPLANELRLMFGMVTVALEEGRIFFVDLVLDEEGGYTDDQNPGEAFMVSSQKLNLAEKRESSLVYLQHLTLPLNDDQFQHDRFFYAGLERQAQIALKTSSISVTSLKYIPQLTMLVVGFSFGGFQIWNIQKMALEYTFQFRPNLDPVVKITFQEPENDPRNYCYLWIVRGQLSNKKFNSNTTSIGALYSLGFESKDWIEGYGFLYQDMLNCVHRFDYPLTSTPLSPIVLPENGSSVIAFECIQQGEILNSTKADLDINSDDYTNQDLSICLVLWEAWNTDCEPSYFLALFDINQWYQAQMPFTLSFDRAGQCSYLGMFSLKELQDELGSVSLLDAFVNPTSLVKYKLSPGFDEMYYPSSLAFKLLCLTELGVIKVSYLGTQRQILWEMESLGPECLISPCEILNICVACGLLPSSNLKLNVVQKREALLSLALYNNMLNFISSCVWHWSENTREGCSLKFFLTWLWKKVTLFKNSSDKLCATLFDYSGRELEQNSLTLLQSYATQLEHLSSILKLMMTQTGPITDAGLQELLFRHEVAHLLSIYFKVIIWFNYCSLLPEHAEGEAYGENEVAYPASTLFGAYHRRRVDLKQLHAAVGQNDLLIIDGLVSQLGDHFPSQWEASGTQPLYPPPSLYALLSTYLMRGPPLEDKHCLALYLLLDMAAFLSDRQSHLEEKLMQFPAAFRMSHSRVKLTQGFWMLDHREFEEAINLFLDPAVNHLDIQPWQHNRILRAFLYQGESKKALRYSQICKPPLNTADEVKLHLTILLANKLIIQAFQYQRQCCDERNTEDLLNHFFTGCQQTGNMNAMLQLPFTPMEESYLVSFLLKSPEIVHQDQLVLYYLQKSQPLEAARIHEQLKPAFLDGDKHWKERSSIRSALVTGYLNTLPITQKKLASQIQRFGKGALTIQSGPASQPAPLSTTIRSSTRELISQSSRLRNLMDKIKETWNTSPCPSPLQSTRKESYKPECIPFISTPSAHQNSMKSTGDIIYATPVRKRSISGLDPMESTKKKSRGLDFSPSSRLDTDRRYSRAINSEVFSLLQTPPVKCKTPSLKSTNISATTSFGKPSSILKVQQMIRRSSTPTQKTSFVGVQMECNGNDDDDNTTCSEVLNFEESSSEVEEMKNSNIGLLNSTEMSNKSKTESKVQNFTSLHPAKKSNIIRPQKTDVSLQHFGNVEPVDDDDDDVVVANFSAEKWKELKFLETDKSFAAGTPIISRSPLQSSSQVLNDKDSTPLTCLHLSNELDEDSVSPNSVREKDTTLICASKTENLAEDSTSNHSFSSRSEYLHLSESEDELLNEEEKFPENDRSSSKSPDHSSFRESDLSGLKKGVSFSDSPKGNLGASPKIIPETSSPTPLQESIVFSYEELKRPSLESIHVSENVKTPKQLFQNLEEAFGQQRISPIAVKEHESLEKLKISEDNLNQLEHDETISELNYGDESESNHSTFPSDVSEMSSISLGSERETVWTSRLRSRSRADSFTSTEATPPPSPLPQTVKPRSAKKQPKSSTTPRNSQRMKEKDESKNLLFSNPIIPEENLDQLNDDDKPTTPAFPFVFSPPTTRSRLRQKKSSESASECLIDTTATEPINVAKSRTSSTRSVQAPPWQTFVNVLSPAKPPTRRKSVSQRSSLASSSTITTREMVAPFKSRRKAKL